MPTRDMWRSLLCRLLGHDWEIIDTEAFEHSKEMEGAVALHFDYTIPKEFRCRRCGTTEDPFEKLTVNDPDGTELQVIRE